MATISPPQFIPYKPSISISPLSSTTEVWTETLVSNCHFGLSTFLAVLKDLCLHPERNSTLILRADGLPLKGVQDAEIPRYASPGRSLSGTSDGTQEQGVVEEGSENRNGNGQGEGMEKMELVEEIRVRLMPRQPNRDGKMDHRCLFFRTPRHTGDQEAKAMSNSTRGHGTNSNTIDTAERALVPEHEIAPMPTDSDPGTTASHVSRQQACVIYAPEVTSRADQPFYYPPVRKLAYRYETLTPSEAETALESAIRAEREKRRAARQRDKQRERAKVLLSIKAKIKAGVAVDDVSRALLEREEARASMKGHRGGVGEGEGGEDDAEEAGEADEEVELDIPPFVGRISIGYLPWDTPPPAVDDGSRGEGQDGAMRIGKAKKRSPLAGNSDNNGHTPIPPSTLAGNMDSLAVGYAENTKDSEMEARKAEQEKLYRICLNLLERVVVPRDAFQDLYLKLKDRHRHLESRKPNPKLRVAKEDDVKRHVYKSTPNSSLPHDPPLPSSHPRLSPHVRPSLPSSSNLSIPVHGTSGSPLDRLRNAPIVPLPANGHPTDISDWGGQDVAIAAFLMLLWRDMYPSLSSGSSGSNTTPHGVYGGDGGEEVREWDSWGRPTGGFVDLGCGNGLLVHVLTAEGYHGKGYELRARRTWPTYPPATQANLVELPIDFPSWFPNTLDEWEMGEWRGRDESAIREGCFIIGNHADEITPWIPLLSLLPRTPVPFLSLPCCAHTLDSLFTHVVFHPPSNSPHPHMPPDGLDAGLEKGQSKYKAYLMYLGYQGLMCGWEWEKEGLRVPSTRGWGIVGRNRWAKTPEQLRECRRWALEQVQGVRTRGAFHVREKEGKDH